MLEIFLAYKKYPYRVPFRVRFFNVFRYFFKFSLLEYLLIASLLKGKKFWRRFIPPFYFYKQRSIRNANRNGINYSLDLSHLIDHSIFFCTMDDPAQENLFKVLKPHFIIIDVGANIGFLTLNFARYCKEGFVFAFEPDSNTFRILKNNVELNSFRNIKIYKKALGSKRDSLHLYKLEKNNPGANRIFYQYVAESKHEVVEVSALDGLMNEFPRVDLLKIDVEGFEMYVLNGAETSIQKWKPILYIELSEVNQKQQGFSAVQLVEYIESLNYNVKDARTMQAMDKSRTDYHTDILCFYRRDEACLE